MFRNLTRTFSEADEFAAAIQNAEAEATLSESGQFTGNITAIGFPSLTMQRISASLPHIMHARLREGRAYITFHADTGNNSYQNGTEITSSDFVKLSAEEPFFLRSVGPTAMAAMSLPVEDINLASITASGGDLMVPRDHSVVSPTSGALATLRRVHDAAIQLSHDAPEVMSHPEVARGLEQVLIESMMRCLTTHDVHESKLSRHHHVLIMRRFHRALEEDPDRPWYVLEMAKAVGASVRSLTTCCQEHLGMGPKKYLITRRLHLARRALRAADPHIVTVTDIATRYGFWQFGRFSIAFKTLFGESPSVTLRRPPS